MMTFRCSRRYFARARKYLTVIVAGQLCAFLLVVWHSRSASIFNPGKNIVANSVFMISTKNSPSPFRSNAVNRSIINGSIIQILSPNVDSAGFPHMQTDFEINEEPLRTWLISNESNCDGKFMGFNRLFAYLKNVVINPEYGSGQKGGEDFVKLMKQREDAEYIKMRRKYFLMQCKSSFKYTFITKAYQRQWMIAMDTTNGSLPEQTTLHKKFTIALQRHEYVNMYWVVNDLYNAFLMLVAFHQHPNNTDILWIDGHPKGGMDTMWEVLFGNVIRAGRLERPTLFEKMVWSLSGYNSWLIDTRHTSAPYLNEFRHFVLSRYGIDENHELNCSNLNILFIWRKDYLAHPRNPSGHVTRKIKNEAELLSSAKIAFPGSMIKGVQLDRFPMENQISMIAHTDIIFAMHGAGLAHTLFLPRKSGLIELFPLNHGGNAHFQRLAEWHGVVYKTWKNYDRANNLEEDYTTVPLKVAIQLLREVQRNLCGSSFR